LAERPPEQERGLDTATLEAIHARVAHALEAAYEELDIARDAELALRNYEVARKHDFNLKECMTVLLDTLALLDATPPPLSGEQHPPEQEEAKRIAEHVVTSGLFTDDFTKLGGAYLSLLAAYEDRSKAFEDAAADCVRLEGALKGVSSAYGDFAGCSAGTRNGSLESDHTPSCRRARAALAALSPAGAEDGEGSVGGMADALAQPDDSPGALARTLRAARKHQGRSLREVEAATGIPNAHVSQIERGVIVKPEAELIVRLAPYFNLNAILLLRFAGHDWFADQLERVEQAEERLELIARNAASWHHDADAKQRALNVIAAWASGGEIPEVLLADLRSSQAHAHAEHLREAREVEQHQEEKHGE
jgi:transcriptional regulator with XRE-family HTH domain